MQAAATSSLFTLHLIARASLLAELPMSVHRDLRIHSPESGDDVAESLSLSRSASVLGSLAISFATAYVAHADGVGIMPHAMRSDETDVTPLLDGAVQTDHEMIAAPCPSALLVPAVDVLYSEVLALRRSGTMDDEFIDLPHSNVLPPSEHLADAAGDT